MVTGLLQALNLPPLDGLLSKSPTRDSDLPGLSFGAILKAKAQQLEKEQFVSADSIAAALAAMQTVLAANVQPPEPVVNQVETRPAMQPAETAPARAARPWTPPAVTPASSGPEPAAQPIAAPVTASTSTPVENTAATPRLTRANGKVPAQGEFQVAVTLAAPKNNTAQPVSTASEPSVAPAISPRLTSASGKVISQAASKPVQAQIQPEKSTIATVVAQNSAAKTPAASNLSTPPETSAKQTAIPAEKTVSEPNLVEKPTKTSAPLAAPSQPETRPARQAAVVTTEQPAPRTRVATSASSSPQPTQPAQNTNESAQATIAEPATPAEKPVTVSKPTGKPVNFSAPDAEPAQPETQPARRVILAAEQPISQSTAPAEKADAEPKPASNFASGAEPAQPETQPARQAAVVTAEQTAPAARATASASSNPKPAPTAPNAGKSAQFAVSAPAAPAEKADAEPKPASNFASGAEPAQPETQPAVAAAEQPAPKIRATISTLAGPEAAPSVQDTGEPSQFTISEPATNDLSRPLTTTQAQPAEPTRAMPETSPDTPAPVKNAETQSQKVETFIKSVDAETSQSQPAKSAPTEPHFAPIQFKAETVTQETNFEPAEPAARVNLQPVAAKPVRAPQTAPTDAEKPVPVKTASFQAREIETSQPTVNAVELPTPKNPPVRMAEVGTTENEVIPPGAAAPKEQAFDRATRISNSSQPPSAAQPQTEKPAQATAPVEPAFQTPVSRVEIPHAAAQVPAGAVAHRNEITPADVAIASTGALSDSEPQTTAPETAPEQALFATSEPESTIEISAVKVAARQTVVLTQPVSQPAGQPAPKPETIFASASTPENPERPATGGPTAPRTTVSNIEYSEPEGPAVLAAAFAGDIPVKTSPTVVTPESRPAEVATTLPDVSVNSPKIVQQQISSAPQMTSQPAETDAFKAVETTSSPVMPEMPTVPPETGPENAVSAPRAATGSVFTPITARPAEQPAVFQQFAQPVRAETDQQPVANSQPVPDTSLPASSATQPEHAASSTSTIVPHSVSVKTTPALETPNREAPIPVRAAFTGKPTPVAERLQPQSDVALEAAEPASGTEFVQATQRGTVPAPKTEMPPTNRPLPAANTSEAKPEVFAKFSAFTTAQPEVANQPQPAGVASQPVSEIVVPENKSSLDRPVSETGFVSGQVDQPATEIQSSEVKAPGTGAPIKVQSHPQPAEPVSQPVIELAAPRSAPAQPQPVPLTNPDNTQDDLRPAAKTPQTVQTCVADDQPTLERPTLVTKPGLAQDNPEINPLAAFEYETIRTGQRSQPPITEVTQPSPRMPMVRETPTQLEPIKVQVNPETTQQLATPLTTAPHPDADLASFRAEKSAATSAPTEPHQPIQTQPGQPDAGEVTQTDTEMPVAATKLPAQPAAESEPVKLQVSSKMAVSTSQANVPLTSNPPLTAEISQPGAQRTTSAGDATPQMHMQAQFRQAMPAPAQQANEMVAEELPASVVPDPEPAQARTQPRAESAKAQSELRAVANTFHPVTNNTPVTGSQTAQVQPVTTNEPTEVHSQPALTIPPSKSEVPVSNPTQSPPAVETGANNVPLGREVASFDSAAAPRTASVSQGQPRRADEKPATTNVKTDLSAAQATPAPQTAAPRDNRPRSAADVQTKADRPAQTSAAFSAQTAFETEPGQVSRQPAAIELSTPSVERQVLEKEPVKPQAQLDVEASSSQPVERPFAARQPVAVSGNETVTVPSNATMPAAQPSAVQREPQPEVQPKLETANRAATSAAPQANNQTRSDAQMTASNLPATPIQAQEKPEPAPMTEATSSPTPPVEPEPTGKPIKAQALPETLTREKAQPAASQPRPAEQPATRPALETETVGGKVNWPETPVDFARAVEQIHQTKTRKAESPTVALTQPATTIETPVAAQPKQTALSGAETESVVQVIAPAPANVPAEVKVAETIEKPEAGKVVVAAQNASDTNQPVSAPMAPSIEVEAAPKEPAATVKAQVSTPRVESDLETDIQMGADQPFEPVRPVKTEIAQVESKVSVQAQVVSQGLAPVTDTGSSAVKRLAPAGTAESETVRAADEKSQPVKKAPETEHLLERAALNPLPGPETFVQRVAGKGLTIPEQFQAAEIVAQIAPQLKARIQSGPSSLRLQLNPKELGAIEVQMVSSPQGVSLTFSAEQPATGRLLETQAGQLRQSLAEAGIQLAGLNIGQHHQPRQEGGFLNQQPQFAQSAQREDAPQETVVAEALRPERVRGPAGEVDYLV